MIQVSYVLCFTRYGSTSRVSASNLHVSRVHDTQCSSRSNSLAPFVSEVGGVGEVGGICEMFIWCSSGKAYHIR